MLKGLVSVMIVSWNGKEHLEKCLPSLYGQDCKKLEVIVVDNGSSDGTVDWLKKNYPKVKVVENGDNYGYAYANDQAYNRTTGEYVLFLSNDTTVKRDTITKLLEVLKSDKSIGGVQSKILLMDSPTQLDSAGSYLTYTGFLFHLGVYAKDGPEFDKQRDVYSAKGACMLFRKEVLKKIEVDKEILDGKYFAYFEETDMCHRVWLAGYRICYVPKSVMYHKFGATSKKLFKPFVEYHSYKNRINSYLKNLGLGKLLIMLPIHLAICEVLSIVFAFKGNFSMFLSIQKAIIWNFVNIKDTLRKRKYIQTKIRKIKDGLIFKNLLVSPKLSYYLSNFLGFEKNRINA